MRLRSSTSSCSAWGSSPSCGRTPIAVSRSRTDAVSVAGVYFLADDVAPRPTRIRFRLALAIQVVVAIVTASIRLYTSVAFGVLVPMFGLGLMGLWGARHGRFAPRDETP